MPRKGKRQAKATVKSSPGSKENALQTRYINSYFASSPSRNENNDGFQISSETVFYNGPSDIERMEAKAVHSITNCIQTPEDVTIKEVSNHLVKKEPVVDVFDVPKSDTQQIKTVSSSSYTNSETNSSESSLQNHTPSPTPEKPTVKKSKRQPRKKKTEESKPNQLITEYFAVRKSSRKTAKVIQREQEETIRRKLLDGCEEGLKISHYEGKGRGIEATTKFYRGDFIVEYAGELIELKEAKSREEIYKRDTSYGCYMYFFNHKGKSYCVDATAESGKLGRLLNHSRTKPNCITRTVDIEDNPFLILVAARDIEPGEELLYDYGERSKDAVDANPWLKV